MKLKRLTVMLLLISLFFIFLSCANTPEKVRLEINKIMTNYNEKITTAYDTSLERDTKKLFSKFKNKNSLAETSISRLKKLYANKNYQKADTDQKNIDALTADINSYRDEIVKYGIDIIKEQFNDINQLYYDGKSKEEVIENGFKIKSIVESMNTDVNMINEYGGKNEAVISIWKQFKETKAVFDKYAEVKLSIPSLDKKAIIADILKTLWANKDNESVKLTITLNPPQDDKGNPPPAELGKLYFIGIDLEGIRRFSSESQYAGSQNTYYDMERLLSGLNNYKLIKSEGSWSGGR